MLSPITLSVPAFRRFDEYVGVWAYEPTRFAAQFSAAPKIDFGSHRQPEPVALVERLPGQKGKSIAKVTVEGSLMKQAASMGGTSTIQLRREIRQAAADPDVSAILLAIDSPGGTVAGTMELAAEVKAATRQKPVWAQIEDLGASAAYWVASQADQVFASNPTTMVGSVGTLLVVYDLSKAADEQGVKTLVFTTGPLKATGVPGSPVTEEQAAELQAMVDGMQKHFDAGVAKGRGMNVSQLAAVKTGGLFLAEDAQKKKLVDGVRPIDATLKALAAAR